MGKKKSRYDLEQIPDENVKIKVCEGQIVNIRFLESAFSKIIKNKDEARIDFAIAGDRCYFKQSPDGYKVAFQSKRTCSVNSSRWREFLKFDGDYQLKHDPECGLYYVDLNKKV